MLWKQGFMAAAIVALSISAPGRGAYGQAASAGLALSVESAVITQVDYYYPGYYGYRYGYRPRYDGDGGLLALPFKLIGGIAGLFDSAFNSGPYYFRPVWVSPYYGSPYYREAYYTGSTYWKEYYGYPYSSYHKGQYYSDAGYDRYYDRYYEVKRYRKDQERPWSRYDYRDLGYYKSGYDAWGYDAEPRYRDVYTDIGTYYGDEYAGRRTYYGAYDDDD